MKKLIISLAALLYLKGAAMGCGWYLMAPPVDMTQTYRYVPLSLWDKYAAFDTAEQCNLGLLRIQILDSDYTNYRIRVYLNKKLGVPTTVPFRIWKKSIQESKCISTDDPNLKQ